MFSALPPLSGPERPREAEETDARLAMYRHNPDRQGRRDKKRGSHHNDIFGEDTANVSTEALLAFLEDFLAVRYGRSRSSGFVESQGVAAQTRAPHSGITPMSHTARAAKAYASAAAMAKRKTVPEPPLPREDADGDIGMILDLIEALGKLVQAGVDQIEIGKGSSFLGSLADSVHRAMPKQ